MPLFQLVYEKMVTGKQHDNARVRAVVRSFFRYPEISTEIPFHLIMCRGWFPCPCRVFMCRWPTTTSLRSFLSSLSQTLPLYSGEKQRCTSVSLRECSWQGRSAAVLPSAVKRTSVSQVRLIMRPLCPVVQCGLRHILNSSYHGDLFVAGCTKIVCRCLIINSISCEFIA